MKAMIKLEELSKKFGEKLAVESFLEVKRGEISDCGFKWAGKDHNCENPVLLGMQSTRSEHFSLAICRKDTLRRHMVSVAQNTWNAYS